MQSLFPMGGGGGGLAALGGFGGAATGSSAPIVEVRAGKCVVGSQQSNGKHMVSADTRPGKIVLQKEADGLVHFKWLNAINNQAEDDRVRKSSLH